MIKILAIFCFIFLGLFAANRLDEKSQKKIAVTVGIVFLMLAIVVIVMELMR